MKNINNKNKRSTSLNNLKESTVDFHIPIIPKSQKRRKIKYHLQIYLEEEVALYLKSFVSKNKISKTQAGNFILKSYFIDMNNKKMNELESLGKELTKGRKDTMSKNTKSDLILDEIKSLRNHMNNRLDSIDIRLSRMENTPTMKKELK